MATTQPICVTDHKILTGMFAVYSLLFPGVCIYEIAKAPGYDLGGLSAGNSMIAMTIWMSPILLLSITSLVGFLLLRRFEHGDQFARGNVSALKFLGLGVVFAGAIEGCLQAFMDNFIPQIIQYGDKDNFLNMAYMAIGAFLLIMAQVMKNAASMKEDYDQFL